MSASRAGEGGIFIALGANLPSELGTPRETLQETLRRLQSAGVALVVRSPWYASKPVPPSDQPWFVNGVAEVSSELAAEPLLALMHEIEADLGRVRRERWEARVVDLDLIDYRGQTSDGALELPHPRMAERSFVLRPMRDIAPSWIHPVTGKAIADLIAALPPDAGEVRKLTD